MKRCGQPKLAGSSLASIADAVGSLRNTSFLLKCPDSSITYWSCKMPSENSWQFFRHPVTLAVQRVRSDDKIYIRAMLKWRWVEIEKPDDWDETDG